MSSPGGGSGGEPHGTVRSTFDTATDVLFRGFIVLVPFVITLYILRMALSLLTDVLQPVVILLQWAGLIRAAHFGAVGAALVRLGIYRSAVGYLAELLALVVLLGLIVVLGALVSFRSGQWFVDAVDAFVTRVPIVGPVYRSFRRMGDVVLESGLENFKDVKLVEFPEDGVYSIGFVTNESPRSVSGALERDDVMTLFLPLAPNPVMGGFLTHVPEERVIDVDMTVEEAARSLITSGIATGETTGRDTLEPFRRIRRVEFEDLTGRPFVASRDDDEP